MNYKTEYALAKAEVSMLRLQLKTQIEENKKLKIRLGNLAEIWHDVQIIFPIVLQMLNVFKGKFVIWTLIFNAGFFITNFKKIRDTVFENQTGDELNPKQGWAMDKQ